MSLINQMLKDLEQRTKRLPVKPEVPLFGHYPAASYRLKKNKKTFGLLLGSMLLFMVILAIFLHTHLNHGLQTPTPTAIIKTRGPIIAATLPNTVANSASTAQTQLTGITLQIQKNKTYLRFLLNRDALYRVNSDAYGQYLMIVFEHTNPIATLPSINYMSSAVKDMRMVTEENGDLKILLTLATGTQLDTLQLNNEGKLPELQVNLSLPENFYSNSAEVSLQDAAVMKEQTGSIKKIMLDMSLGEKYQEAINIAAQGNVKKSIQLLTEITTTHPDFFQGRLSLATLLFEQGNTLRAQRLLEIGLQQRPLDPSYIELKARILISQGKSNSALKLLQTVSPPLDTHSDYHALVAALYQRLGQPQLAAQLYEQLLTLHPDNAVWWMGLGIALENSGKQSQALMAYSKADNSDSLSPELKIYIENRMHNLS